MFDSLFTLFFLQESLEQLQNIPLLITYIKNIEAEIGEVLRKIPGWEFVKNEFLRFEGK